MSLFEQFETDASLEKSGILLEYGPNKDLPVNEQGVHPAIAFRISRAGGANDAYNKKVEFLAKKHRRAIQNETIDSGTLQDITKQAFVETVLLGWENVTDKDKNPLPYNRDNAMKLFKLLPDLYTDLLEQSNKAALFRSHLREEDAKN